MFYFIDLNVENINTEGIINYKIKMKLELGIIYIYILNEWFCFNKINILNNIFKNNLIHLVFPFKLCISNSFLLFLLFF